MSTRHGTLKLLGFSAVGLVLTACASSPSVEPASERLGMAKSALEQARVSDADDLAPALYNQAQSKVARAEQAIRDDNGMIGERLAHEATLDARLARLQADRIEQQQLLAEIQAAIEALEQELAPRG